MGQQGDRTVPSALEGLTTEFGIDTFNVIVRDLTPKSPEARLILIPDELESDFDPGGVDLALKVDFAQVKTLTHIAC